MGVGWAYQDSGTTPCASTSTLPPTPRLPTEDAPRTVHSSSSASDELNLHAFEHELSGRIKSGVSCRVLTLVSLTKILTLSLHSRRTQTMGQSYAKGCKVKSTTDYEVVQA